MEDHEVESQEIAELERMSTEGARVEELLRSGTLKKRFDALRAQYVDAALNTPAADDMGRYRLLQAAIVLDTVMGQLLSAKQDGEISRKQLEEIRRGNDRRKILGVV